MLCHCFSEHWSFFPFSSETLVNFFLCILNESQQILIFHLCHYSMARLAALWLIPMYGNVSSSTLWSVAFIWYTLHCLYKLVQPCWYDTITDNKVGFYLYSHCSDDSHCQYISPFVCCSVSLIVVEKSPNTSYRAMQYLQNELLTSILCQIEPDSNRHLKFGFNVKNFTFSFFHTPISRNSLDLDLKKLAYVSF